MSLDILRYYRPNKVIYVDGKLYRGRARKGMVLYDSNTNTFNWVSIANICPLENKVLDGEKYGDKTGTLGKINTNNLDIDQQVRDRIETIINLDYPDYTELSYLFDITKNNYNQNKKRYGILTKNKIEQDAIGCSNIDSFIEIIIVNSFKNIGKNDDKQKLIRKELEEVGQKLFRRITASRGGMFKNATYNQDFAQDEIEFIEDNNNLGVLRISFSVNIPINLG